MIEVEKKFQITNAQRDRLLEGAEFVYKKDIRDTDFDRGVELCTKDLWLRERDGRFELKYPLHTKGHGSRKADQYREYETDAEIIGALTLTGEMLSAEGLATQGFSPIVSYVTTRTSYEKEGFTIVIDHVDFGYTVCEIERMTEEGGDIDALAEEISAFAQAQGLSTDPVLGKALVYFKRFDRPRLQARVEAGIIDCALAL